jgi:hypothetical protein
MMKAEIGVMHLHHGGHYSMIVKVGRNDGVWIADVDVGVTSTDSLAGVLSLGQRAECPWDLRGPGDMV